MIVADASVVLKWILPDERDREEALALRQRHLMGKDTIAAPDLLLYEAANVLPFKWEQVEPAEERFRELCAAELYLHSFELPGFARAMNLAHRYGITTYDASYLALAQILRCRFVTADERLMIRLKGVPHVFHLRQAAR